jgi:rhodanese-related sulfurtransferase
LHDTGGPALNFFVENWYLFLMAVVSGGLLLWPALRGGAGAGAGAVSTSEAVRLINREKGVLIDVGDAAEFAGGHATGARNVPLSKIETSKDLPGNKTLPLVLLCPTGARASRAAAQLRKAGYQNVVPVAGGTAAWREANLPLEKSA